MMPGRSVVTVVVGCVGSVVGYVIFRITAVSAVHDISVLVSPCKS